MSTSFRSRVISVRIPTDGGPVLATASCAFDPMGEPVVAFRAWREGAWRDVAFLRADCTREIVELFVGEPGDLVLTDVWELTGRAREHITALCAGGQAEHVFEALRALTRHELDIGPPSRALLDAAPAAVRRLATD